MEKQMLFGHYIDRYFDEILSDLEKLITFPSVCDAESAQKPFGQACKDTLDFVLETADKLGLSTTNVDYYAGDASLGDGDSYIDVLTHVDVVPAGDGWDTNPFKLVKKDQYLYGRGTADDKGAAIAALYALKALKDAGIKGKHCLRVVFGCGEEIGSDDLDHYYKKKGYPLMGFTPDCSYGICNSEKGILRIDFMNPHASDSVIKAIHAGTAVNAVPSQASAKIICTDEQYDRLFRLTGSASGFSLERNKDSVHITASGKAAHGAEPELGENAAAKLLGLLSQVFTAKELGMLFTFATEKIGMEYNGTSLGIEMEDQESGTLTLNLGIISCINDMETLSIDIRHPVTAKKDQILAKLREAAKPYHVTITVANYMAPLHVPSDSLLVSTLSEAFEAVTQEKCNIYSTGGGTYARHANNTVAAFGPAFRDEPSSNAHGPNEYIELEHYKLHCRVCLEAMYRLFLA